MRFFFRSFQIMERFDACIDPAEGKALYYKSHGSEHNRLPLYTVQRSGPGHLVPSDIPRPCQYRLYRMDVS